MPPKPKKNGAEATGARLYCASRAKKKMGQRENVYEMIAMYLTASPVPPLPMHVCITKNPTTTTSKKTKEEDDDDADAGKDGYTSSHDLLAGLLIAAMAQDSPDANKVRMEKQLKLSEEVAGELERIAGALVSGQMERAAAVQAMFNACMRYTGGFVLAFQRKASVVFGTLSDVDRGDKVHAACSHWMAAQDILMERDPSKRRTAAQFQARFSYADLLHEQLITRCARAGATLDPLLLCEPPPPQAAPPAAAAPQQAEA